jgi:hypothetical protein
MSPVWWSLVAVGILLAGVACFGRPAWKASRASRLAQAKRRFHAQREGLEAKFVQLASARRKPESHRWIDCSFADDVVYVRKRATGELSAFVAMTIAGDDVGNAPRGSADAVGNLQAGTAVFRFDRDHWVTDGKAILNLNPDEAIRYYHADLEIVAEEVAHRA